MNLKERAEFEGELLDWEHYLLSKASGPKIRCMLMRDGKQEIIMIPEEVAGFLLTYNDRK